MKRFILILTVFILLSACSDGQNKNSKVENQLELQSETKPNILLIVLDDAAYSDFGVYGGEIETPHIDALAGQSLSFSQFHVTPNCSSTRASLLTGMDHHRTGLGTHGVATKNQKGKPGYEGFLNNRVITLAEAMQAAGYRTMMAGKWHLGSRDPNTWPAARGFDDTFALINGGASHWQDNLPLFPSKPSIYSRNGKAIKKLPEGFYSTTNYTSAMIDFIDTNSKSGKPFMGYLAYTAPHNPLHAPAETIAKYKDRYKTGWDALQQFRLAGLKSKGLINKNVPVQPRPSFIPAWKKLSPEEQSESARDMAIYAAMLDVIDQNLGRLFEHLRATGQYDNTMIILISDNGPSKTTIADYLALDGAGSEFIKSFNNNMDNRGLPGSSVDLGPGWAYGLAAPFRLMKGYQAQGGIKSPLIVKLPKGMEHAGGSMQNSVQAPVHVMDVMPTILDIAEVALPATASEIGKLEMQGVSLLPIMSGASKESLNSRGFGGELFGVRYYRQGQWKILLLPKPYGTGDWQLFDLSSDPGELNDISASHPKVFQQLISDWQNYAKTNGVVEPDTATFYTLPPKSYLKTL